LSKILSKIGGLKTALLTFIGIFGGIQYKFFSKEMAKNLKEKL
jgi:hypothetical protein